MGFEKINKTIDEKSIKEIKTIDNNRFIDENRLGITARLRKMLADPLLDENFLVYAKQYMAEGQLINIAEYCQRKASVHKGRAFVKICTNVIAKNKV